MKKILLIVIMGLSSNIYGQHNQEILAKGIIEYEDLFNTSMQKRGSCYRIPAIITAPNGDLIAAIDERIPSCSDLKWNKDINIVIRRSSDNGKSWSKIETIIDFPNGKSASDPSMIVDKSTKEIFLFYNYMDLNKEKNIYYLHVVKSADNGKTWSIPKDITSQITKAKEWYKDFKFITSGRGIQTSTDKLLHCMVNLNSGMHLFGSDDHGKSWYFIDTPISPANESKIVELANGNWMINARTNKGMRYVHISDDEGKTWTSKAEPQLIDPGCNGSIIRYTLIKNGYKKNRLLFSNAKMKKGRKNMTVRISYDEGKTWSEGKTIYTGESAYSSLTVLKNGNIGLFFEKDGYKQNPFVSFSLEWLTNGQDSFEKNKDLNFN